MQTLIWRAVITLYRDNIRARKAKLKQAAKGKKQPKSLSKASKVKCNFSNWIFPEDHQVWAKAASQSHLKTSQFSRGARGCTGTQDDKRILERFLSELLTKFISARDNASEYRRSHFRDETSLKFCHVPPRQAER